VFKDADARSDCGNRVQTGSNGKVANMKRLIRGNEYASKNQQGMLAFTCPNYVHRVTIL